MKVTQLNHAAIHVADVERSARFYADVLGLEPMPRPGFPFPGAWFKVGADQELHIIGGREQPPGPEAGHRGIHTAFCVQSIREAEQRLKDKGIEHRSPKTRPDGAWQIFLEDPDGHIIELCQLPD